MQQRMLIREVPSQIGKEVFLKGWVSVRRDHGKLVFLDVRDRSGSVQVVVFRITWIRVRPCMKYGMRPSCPSSAG